MVNISLGWIGALYTIQKLLFQVLLVQKPSAQIQKVFAIIIWTFHLIFPWKVQIMQKMLRIIWVLQRLKYGFEVLFYLSSKYKNYSGNETIFTFKLSYWLIKEKKKQIEFLLPQKQQLTFLTIKNCLKIDLVIQFMLLQIDFLLWVEWWYNAFIKRINTTIQFIYISQFDHISTPPTKKKNLNSLRYVICS